VLSEYGDRHLSSTLEIQMDGSQQECPVTFYANDVPVFSMGNDEIEAFCEALKKFQL
jgi:hypothetical protein